MTKWRYGRDFLDKPIYSRFHEINYNGLRVRKTCDNIHLQLIHLIFYIQYCLVQAGPRLYEALLLTMLQLLEQINSAVRELWARASSDWWRAAPKPQLTKKHTHRTVGRGSTVGFFCVASPPKLECTGRERQKWRHGTLARERSVFRRWNTG